MAPGQHRVLVVHGPNLNLLGLREPELYGDVGLESIDGSLREAGVALGCVVECRQSNSESEIIGWIHGALEDFDGVVINPAAYTHTSVAIRDAIAGTGLPTVEVHLTNIHAREDFRRTSLTAPVCLGTIAGFGARSYGLGLRALMDYLKAPEPQTTQSS